MPKQIRLIRHAESVANVGLATATPDSIPLTEKGQRQAGALPQSITLIPDLIVSSPFTRAKATALPTALHYPDVPFELWAVEEFTYLSPSRFTGSTQADRKPHTESYWESGDATMIDGPGAESFDHLLGRADAMLAKLADHDAQDILVFSHGQFIRAAAWRIKHGDHASSQDLMREFRVVDVREPLRNCWSYQLVFDGCRWTVECQLDASGLGRFKDKFCTI